MCCAVTSRCFDLSGEKKSDRLLLPFLLCCHQPSPGWAGASSLRFSVCCFSLWQHLWAEPLDWGTNHRVLGALPPIMSVLGSVYPAISLVCVRGEQLSSGWTQLPTSTGNFHDRLTTCEAMMLVSNHPSDLHTSFHPQLLRSWHSSNTASSVVSGGC